MLNFALIGASGFIAPRHLKAIKETGNRLVAALDPFDSVGILDSYFPDCHFFTEFERFECHAESLKGTPQQIDYVVVCSPNYLHDAHVRFGLRIGANVICEKPLVLDPGNIAPLEKLEKATGKSVFNIFQLRLHPAIIALKKRVELSPSDKIYDLDLTYITSRGNWYFTSWKGDVSKSGGLATNIGVHFYDMLSWVFGEVKENTVHLSTGDCVAGFLEFDKARVRYFLSINVDTLPAELKVYGKRTYRSMEMDGEEIEFSDGFTDLHTESYRHILSGQGYRPEDARRSIQIVHQIRNSEATGLKDNSHPFAKLYPVSIS
ncbi:MAG: Gfo/Idh/MocA family oxidoreductase [Prolixibacteraceae bacterium]